MMNTIWSCLRMGKWVNAVMADDLLGFTLIDHA